MGWERVKNFFGERGSVPMQAINEPVPVSPPVRISQPFDASAKDLWNRALSNPEKSEGTILLKMEESLFRYVPLSIVETSRVILSETGDAERVARYVENAFYIYRATVCSGWVAVLYKNGDAYEWPSPSKFSWSSIDAVILGGEHIHGTIPEKNKTVVITRPMIDGKEEKTEIMVGSSGKIIDSVTSVENIVSSRDIDFLNKSFKYRIPDVEMVGFMGQQGWQRSSLRAFANPLYAIILGIVRGEISKDDARKHVDVHLENISKFYPCGIARYVRSGERADPNIGMFMFMG